MDMRTCALTPVLVVKFCAVDDQVAIVGNGNQDTQSWAHSQGALAHCLKKSFIFNRALSPEINIMVDSKEVVAEWMKGLNANQNTKDRGLVDSDGIWRHEDGKELEVRSSAPPPRRRPGSRRLALTIPMTGSYGRQW